MKRASWMVAGLLIARLAAAHDMFLIVEDHDLPVDSEVTIALYNGTFGESLNSIDRDRMTDVSVVDGAGGVSHPEPTQWRDENNASLLTFDTGEAGTYLVGISTRARNIELSAEDFNEYLEHDGVLDVLAARKEAGILDQPAVERYSKHVKTIVQVGEAGGDSWKRVLGYPIEIVPTADPSSVCVGDDFRFQVLADGKPVADQLVYASYEGYHAHSDTGGHVEAVSTHTDASGFAQAAIGTEGRWYVRLIRMVEVAEEGLDYESNWATLTFEIDC